MKNSCFIVLFLLGIIPSAFAQLIGFEEEVPEAFTVSGKGEVKISSLFYKEGESSLEWDFSARFYAGCSNCSFIVEYEKREAVRHYLVDL